jgi:pantoate--beta-alanine ligase
VRDDDGLALSSRNAYRAPAQRGAAATLPAVLRRAAIAIAAGAEVRETLSEGRASLREAGFDPIDYLALCDAVTLEPLEHLTNRTARLLAAAWQGGTRLIDNWPVARFGDRVRSA